MHRLDVCANNARAGLACACCPHTGEQFGLGDFVMREALLDAVAASDVRVILKRPEKRVRRAAAVRPEKQCWGCLLYTSPSPRDS